MWKIEGVLRTASPLHITAPGDRKTRLPGDMGANAAQFPMQAVQRMRLPQTMDEAAPVVSMRAADSDPSDDSDVAGEEAPRQRVRVPEVPVIPANNVRGRLRRECARVMFDALIERGEKLTIDAYNAVVCGAVTGNPDSAPPTLTEIREAREHPFFGLWGGGPRMLRSGLRVDTCMPICEETRSYVPSVFDPQFAVAGGGRDLVQLLWRRRNDDVLSFADPKYASATIDDFVNAIDQYQQERGKAKSAADDDNARGVRSFTAYEVVSPGVPFRFGFEVDGTLAHLGLFLHGWQRFIRAQSIGGLGRVGYGRFEVLETTIYDTETNTAVPKVFAASIVSKPVDQRYNFSDNALVVKAINAWNDAKLTISAGQIEKLMKPAVKKAKD